MLNLRVVVGVSVWFCVLYSAPNILFDERALIVLKIEGLGFIAWGLRLLGSGLRGCRMVHLRFGLVILSPKP